MLTGKLIYLRPVEPADALQIMMWENDPAHWRVSGTEAPYSLHAIQDYINSIQSFRASGELRLMICKKDSQQAIGTLDLFEANFKHQRAGVGILIAEVGERKKGFAQESLFLLAEYANEVLGFYNLTANVLEDNVSSIHLFEGAGYELVGTRKNWFKDKEKRINERIYQLCLKK
jgi:diamine N-acetyltransferase